MAVPRSSEDSGTSLPILRPKPQHYWQITPISTQPGTPRSPSTDASTKSGHSANPSTSSGTDADESSAPGVPRSRSVLNMTSSTLFGIYSSPGDGSGTEISPAPTPALGSMTPIHSRFPTESAFSGFSDTDRTKLQAPPPYVRKVDKKESTARQTFNVAVLMGLGMLYGGVVATLHDDEAHLIPIRLGLLDSHGTWHIYFWGIAAAGAGWVLPWLDRWWAEKKWERDSQGREEGVYAAAMKRMSTMWEGDGSAMQGNETRGEGLMGGEVGRAGVPAYAFEDLGKATGWSRIVRALGAYFGAIFVIRRLRWDPALQTTLTLGLSNPMLWYVIDGSATGLVLSATVSMCGAALVVGAGPGLVSWDGDSFSSNATIGEVGAGLGSISGMFAAGTQKAAEWAWGHEGMVVWFWVASALFSGVLCFGNIGRMMSGERKWW